MLNSQKGYQHSNGSFAIHKKKKSTTSARQKKKQVLTENDTRYISNYFYK